MIHGPPLALATVLHLTLPPDPTPKHTPVQIAPKQLKLLRLSVKKRYHSQKQLTGTATNHPKQPPSKNCFSANFISKSNNSQTTHTPQTPKHWCQAPNFRQFLVPGWDSNNQKYLVLGRSANSHQSQKNQRDKAPVIERRPVEPYAYGWFGAKMNRHPHRSFGYQQAYTQWAFE